MDKDDKHIIIILLGVVIIVYLINTLSPPPLYPEKVAQLEANISNYIDIKNLNNAISSDNKFHDMAIIIDKDNRKLHPLHNNLPVPFRSENPNDAKIIIWIEQTLEPIYELAIVSADYNPLYNPKNNLNVDKKIPFYRVTWQLTFIDMKNAVIIDKVTFVGQDPRDFSESIFWGIGLAGYPWTDKLHVTSKGGTELRGIEVIYGTEGGIELATGEIITGIAARSPEDKVLDYIKQKFEKS